MLLFFIDLDEMKRINDTLGHGEGDKALFEVATLLRETFRSSDVIARIGGDEFAVLAIDAAEEDSKVLMGHLRNMTDIHNLQGNRKYMISLSIGYSYYDPEKPCSVDELMSKADELMYEQKRCKKTLSI